MLNSVERSLFIHSNSTDADRKALVSSALWPVIVKMRNAFPKLFVREAMIDSATMATVGGMPICSMTLNGEDEIILRLRGDGKIPVQKSLNTGYSLASFKRALGSEKSIVYSNIRQTFCSLVNFDAFKTSHMLNKILGHGVGSVDESNAPYANSFYPSHTAMTVILNMLANGTPAGTIEFLDDPNVTKGSENLKADLKRFKLAYDTYVMNLNRFNENVAKLRNIMGTSKYAICLYDDGGISVRTIPGSYADFASNYLIPDALPGRQYFLRSKFEDDVCACPLIYYPSLGAMETIDPAFYDKVCGAAMVAAATANRDMPLNPRSYSITVTDSLYFNSNYIVQKPDANGPLLLLIDAM